VVKEVPDIVFLLVGGEKAQVRNIRALSRKLGVERYVRVPGKKAIEEMPAYMEACDLLLSFRKIGTNTPLKLYSYLWSGKPTVATNLPVHTQVLDNNVAELTEPTPEAFARGVITLARDRELRLKMGRDARRLAEQKYTYDIYLTKIRDLCSYVEKKKHA
jgi:glycosyltransferase involved in cell wall biosynthesis